MAFYQKYKTDLTTGRFQPFGFFQKPNHKIESNDRLFAYIRSNNRVLLSGWAKKDIFLMNASNRPRMRGAISVFPHRTYELQAFNRYVWPEGSPITIAADSRGILDIDAMAEPGGFLVLTRKN
jgi:hypothetical protein